MRTTLISLILVLGSMVTGVTTAATYKWVDEEGNVNYSQVPPPGHRKVEKIAPPPAVAPPPPTTETAKQTGEKRAEPDKGEQQPAVDTEQEAEIYKRNCEIATSNLDVYKTSNRIKTPDGNIVRLTDEMREQKIMEAQEAIEKYCR